MKQPPNILKGVRAGLGLFFPIRFGFRALFFSSVRLGQKCFCLRSKLLLFRSVSGPIFKEGFYFSEFNLIFLGLIIQEIEFLVGFSHVCPCFPAFLLSLGCSGQKYITLGYLQFSINLPVWFGFLKTQELWVKFRVGIDPTQP